MSGKEAGDFNNTKNRGLREKSTEKGLISELAQREQEAWQNTLGARVEVKPLPKIVTPEVRMNLEQLGLGLRYIPALDLSYLSYLSVGIDRYLTDKLQRKYPKWNPYESLSYKEQIDHSVPRNLERWFWGEVENRDISFPVLPGQWLAVETVEKPEYGTKYPRTPFAERIGFQNDRFRVSWYEAHKAIVREKESILSDIGLSRPPANIRFLEATEYNLLANREGWGKTNTYEWTNTARQERMIPKTHALSLLATLTEVVRRA
jgi:hypothetical protein